MGVENPSDDEIRDILRKCKTIAVIGMSKNPEKDAYSIPAYMKMKGYRIIPVNPSADEILGEKSYKRLADVPDDVDIVDVFRPSEDVPNYVGDILLRKPKVFWLQLGIENNEAEERVASAGIRVVFNKCLMQEHKRLLRT
ncbi:MAG TPA: CoA-binding protein [Nitrososphaerales archaeon]|nr:CoA-binding protein [Nitrososphaerales archaeon]